MQDGRVTKYKTKNGYSVEVVQLADTGNHDGQWLRVRYHGYYVADVRSVLELETYFPLADLEEALTGKPATAGLCRIFGSVSIGRTHA